MRRGAVLLHAAIFDVLDGHFVPPTLLRQAHRGPADVRTCLAATALAKTDLVRLAQ
jgi:hypothetical protein